MKKKIKKTLAANEKRNEIERLKEELRNHEDKLLTVETKNSEVLTDVKYEEKDILHDIVASKSKLAVGSIQINKIEKLVLPS